MNTGESHACRAGAARPWKAVFAALALAVATPAAGQLRPLEPLPHDVFSASDPILTARAGVGIHLRQKASLAGTEGTLLELGNAQLTWRSGRVAVELAGTVLRRFRDERVFADPYGDARADAGPVRLDAGDLRVLTAVRLTPDRAPALAYLRFGTRLPTTDNRLGLDRDRTDFLALLGGRLHHGGWSAAAETGVGIHGSRELRLEQSDVLLYALSLSRSFASVTPHLTLLGHVDGLPGGSLRGNEDLSEIRAGLRTGGRVWVQAELVRGLRPFSPRTGFLLSAGWSR